MTDRSLAIIEDGRALNQELVISGAEAAWGLTFSSRSGKTRNRDYGPALRVVLARLGDVGGLLEGAFLDSRTVASWSEDRRRLPLPTPYPIALTRSGAEVLRREICASQADARFRRDDATGSGQAWKRIELRVKLREPMSRDEFVHLILRGVVPEGRLVGDR